jgi:hypothetical protein
LGGVKLKKTEGPKERESLLKPVVWSEEKAKTVSLVTEKWEPNQQAWVSCAIPPYSQ